MFAAAGGAGLLSTGKPRLNGRSFLVSEPQLRAPIYSIRTSGFFPLILNSLILYTHARGFFAHTHARIASNPAAFSLHHRPGQPLSQGACNSASSHQRGERRAASVQSCAPVGPWPAVQESPATARLSPRRARRFHSHSHAPRYTHIHARRVTLRHMRRVTPTHTYTYTRPATLMKILRWSRMRWTGPVWTGSQLQIGPGC